MKYYLVDRKQEGLNQIVKQGDNREHLQKLARALNKLAPMKIDLGYMVLNRFAVILESNFSNRWLQEHEQKVNACLVCGCRTINPERYCLDHISGEFIFQG